MKTFFDKVWSEHVIAKLGDDADLLQIDRLVLHELSGSQAVRALAEAGREPMSRGQVFTVIEHLISTKPGRGPNERRLREHQGCAHVAGRVRCPGAYRGGNCGGLCQRSGRAHSAKRRGGYTRWSAARSPASQRAPGRARASIVVSS